MKIPKLMKGFEVEWCVELPIVPGTKNDADIDRAKYARADFADKPAAMAYAKSVLPKDCFGAVRVTEFEMQEIEPGVRAWDRDYVADSEEVS